MTEAQVVTAGTLLRQAREAVGMDVSVLASALKVPVGKLQALEADDFTALPDAVFARALASSVCRALKIDAAPVLQGLPQGQAPRLVSDADGINATFKDPQDKRLLPWSLPAVPRGASLAVLALLIAAALVYFLPTGMLEIELSKTGVPSQASESAPLAAQAPDVQEQAVEAAEPAPAKAPTPAPASAPAAPTVAATAAGPAPVADGGAGAAGAAGTAIGSLLEFKASAESWVQVRDAGGSVVFERVLKAGQTAQAGGKPPLAVVIGKASATEVLVRGAPFDLTAVARENVARFEVK